MCSVSLHKSRLPCALAALFGCNQGTDHAAVDDETLGESSSGASEPRVLAVPDDFSMCLFTPQRQAIGGAPYFYRRGIVSVEPAELLLPDASPGVVSGSLSLGLALDREGGEPQYEALEGRLSVELDRVPSAVYSFEDVPGWETAVFSDGADVDAALGAKMFLQVAYPTGTTVFDLAQILDLDREKRLRVVAYAPPISEGQPDLRVSAGPCSVTDVAYDRIDVTLLEGTATFYTRPAFWRSFYGFTVSAQGEIGEVSFDVDSYWDLEYATGDMATGLYGVDPLIAVRFPEATDGACIMVFEPDIESFEGKYLAALLDCEQNHLRDLTVEAVEVTPAAGDSPW